MGGFVPPTKSGLVSNIGCYRRLPQRTCPTASSIHTLVSPKCLTTKLFVGGFGMFRDKRERNFLRSRDIMAPKATSYYVVVFSRSTSSIYSSQRGYRVCEQRSGLRNAVELLRAAPTYKAWQSEASLMTPSAQLAPPRLSRDGCEAWVAASARRAPSSCRQRERCAQRGKPSARPSPGPEVRRPRPRPLAAQRARGPSLGARTEPRLGGQLPGASRRRWQICGNGGAEAGQGRRMRLSVSLSAIYLPIRLSVSVDRLSLCLSVCL